jgi:NAD+ diphosphatase
MMTGVTFDLRVPGDRIEPSSDHPCAAVLGRDLVVRIGSHGAAALPRIGELPPGQAPDLLGTWYGQPVWGMAVTEAPSGFQALRWSACLSQPDCALTGLAARAIQVVRFRAEHRYCGACRTELRDTRIPYGRVCPSCALTVYASNQPVALVALWREGARGREVLLARHTYGVTDQYVLIGGWVDAAETLEHAAHQEVSEEVGLAAEDLTYFGSEGWGLNGTGVLLALFTGRVADPTAEPVVDTHEIAEARFFPLDDLPYPLPPPRSLVARALSHLASGALPRS